MIRSCCIALLLWAGIAPLHAGADPVAQDGLEAVLAGEFALQAGHLPEAANWYLQAARAEGGDAGLAERAARIALLANDDARAAQALKLWKARAPHSLAMRAAEATLLLRQGKAAPARRELAALIAEPGDQGWQHALNALGDGHNPELSAKILQSLVKADALPDSLPAWLGFGHLAQSLDSPRLNARMLAEVLRRFPDEPRVALFQAVQYRQAGQFEQARQVLAGLHDKALLLPQLRLPLAAEYEAMGDHAAAAAILAQGPQDNYSYGLRAGLLARTGDDAALSALYAELENASLENATAGPDPEWRLLLGQMAQFLKRPQQALDWYRSVPSGPYRAEAQLRVVESLYDLGQPQAAFAEAAVLQADAALDDRVRIGAYLTEAELRHKAGDAAGELDAYARGLAVYPNDSELLYARALQWERRDDIARAEADFRRILAAEPDSVAALNALGYILADRTTRYQEALEMISRARAAAPDDAAIIDSYGWVLYRLGRHEEALVELRRAFALHKDAEIAAHVAEVLWASGRHAEARRWFEQAARIDPENRSLKRALERAGA